MAVWKKVVVSGSAAHLLSVTASAVSASQHIVTPTQVLGAASLTGTIITGSFSGSFSGTVSATITSAVSSSVVQITDQSTNVGTHYLTFVGATTGHPSQSIDSALTYVPSTDTLTVGALTSSGDIQVNGGDIFTNQTTATVFNANATTVSAFGAATTFNLANNGANAAITIGSSTSTSSFGGSVVINGGLDVNGTLTTIETTNLLVSDQFVLLGSGSATNKDGGIIIQSAAGVGSGFAFAYDDTTDRWYFQDGLAATATAIGAISYTTTAAAVAVQRDAAANRPSDGTGPLYGGTNGWGNMWIDSDSANDIWIYV